MHVSHVAFNLLHALVLKVNGENCSNRGARQHGAQVLRLLRLRCHLASTFAVSMTATENKRSTVRKHTSGISTQMF